MPEIIHQECDEFLLIFKVRLKTRDRILQAKPQR
jgi:hypothetical protein